MPWRFRKSVKLGPLGRVNIGKKGMSFTTGGKGPFHQTIGHGQTRTTMSIPGTGISYTHIDHHHPQHPHHKQPQHQEHTMQMLLYTCNQCGWQFTMPPGGPPVTLCPRCGR